MKILVFIAVQIDDLFVTTNVMPRTIFILATVYINDLSCATICINFRRLFLLEKGEHVEKQ
jgi:hypothetical protein